MTARPVSTAHTYLVVASARPGPRARLSMRGRERWPKPAPRPGYPERWLNMKSLRRSIRAGGIPVGVKIGAGGGDVDIWGAGRRGVEMCRARYWGCLCSYANITDGSERPVGKVD